VELNEDPETKKQKGEDFCKRVSSETRENEPESPDEEARIEKFLCLVLPKRCNLGDESGVLRRERREEEEAE